MQHVVGPIAGQLPGGRGPLGVVVAGDAAERDAAAAGEDRPEIEIVGQMADGRFEREKAGPRIGEAESGPIAGQFGLQRRLGSDLAGAK